MTTKEVFEGNKSRGFWDATINIPIKMKELGFTEEEITAVNKAFRAQKLMLVVSELAEALEADRKDLMDDKLPEYPGFDVELADAQIRIMDMAGGYDIDLDKLVKEKLIYNSSRPFMHGKKY